MYLEEMLCSPSIMSKLCGIHVKILSTPNLVTKYYLLRLTRVNAVDSIYHK